MQQTENKMGTAPMLKLIISMSVPSMLSMFIQALYNIVDGIFVANYSHAGLEAVNLAYPMQMLLISVGVGTGVGINSLVSRRLGAKKYDEADSAATHGILLSVFSWIVFLIISLTAVKPFVKMMGASGAVAQDSITYLSIVLTASFGMFVQISCEKVLQATGNMIFPMLFQLTGAVINIIFDPLLIFGIGIFPEMGVAGAAVATVGGQIIAMIFSACILFFKKHDVRVTFKDFKFDINVIKEIYKVGFPAIIMQSIGSVLVSSLNAILMTLGSGTAVNVFGIYFKLQSFVFMPVFGLNQGLMPIMGYSYGARNKMRLMQAVKFGIMIALCIMAVGVAVFMSVPQLLLKLFNPDAAMLAMGTAALRIISLCFLPAAVGIVISTMFQAVGTGVYSLIISVLRQLILVLPVAYILSRAIGVTGVWWAFPIAETGGLTASILFLIHIYKTRVKGL